MSLPEEVIEKWVDEFLQSLSPGRVYIYALCEPNDPENVRYIGSTRRVGEESTEKSFRRRMYGHSAEARGCYRDSLRGQWIAGLERRGLKPIIRLVDYTDDSLSRGSLEGYWTAFYKKAGFSLVNDAFSRWYRLWMEVFNEDTKGLLGPWPK